MDKISEANLREAMRKLDTFLDPTNTRCGVSAEVRETARLYLDSWVAGPLREIIDHIDAEARDE